MYKKQFIVLIFAILFIITITSCGHKKNPTGGRKDTVKPEIVSVIPDEYSDITNSNIEIIFSKPIERSSILSGIYIYPPILQKKYSWNGNILTIKILEELEKNTNYYFSFTNKIKGEHGNLLAEAETFIFASGELNSYRISGNILFEEESDKNKPIKFIVLTADSTQIFSKNITDKKYVIEDLNGIKHLVRAYIDVNANERYDQATEPFFQKSIDPVTNPVIDVYLAYSDTLKPRLASTNTINSNNIVVNFTEPVMSFSKISISSTDSLNKTLDIVSTYLDKDELSILSTQQDTLQYKIILEEIIDNKSNLTLIDSILFDGSTINDTIPPEVISSNPRTGSSVDTILPKISVKFSEIILEGDIDASLVEVETGKSEEIVFLNKNDKHYIFASQHKLNNYSSYKFVLNAKDFSGNIITKPLEIIFLPIVRESKK